MERGYVRRLKTAEVSRLGMRRHKKVMWFSQASTGEKNLACDMPPFWLGTAGRIDGCFSNSRSVPLGRTDELASGPSASR
jgi:hypothetical protein